MAKMRTVDCPQCGAKVKWSQESAYRPFCSERCKQIDLGEWASETYRVPASNAPDERDTSPGSDQD